MAQQQRQSRTTQILAAIEHIHREGGRLSVRYVRAAPNVVDQRMRTMAQVYDLLVRNRKATKRDLFYEHKKLYGKQANFDRALSALCKQLNACRNELNVVGRLFAYFDHFIGCSRGFAIGNLRLFDGMDDDVVVDFRSSPVALVESLCHFNLVHSDAQFLLVVEKDAIFQRLIDEQFTHKFPRSILITGRGYPDFCTRQFLHWLSIQLPMLVLVDADPYGVEIFLTYKYGSSRSAIEAGALHLPRLRWLGFLPSEAQTLPIPHNQFLQLSEADRKRIERIAQRVNQRQNAGDSNSEERTLFNYELSVMLNSAHKLELEALCAISANYLSTVYLDNKLVPLNVAVAYPHNCQFNNNGDQQQQQNQQEDFSDIDWSDNNDDDDFGSDWDDANLAGTDSRGGGTSADFDSDQQNDDADFDSDQNEKNNADFDSDQQNDDDDFSDKNDGVVQQQQNTDFDSDQD
ncbi:hypothetical protein niasHT_001921 [Heterodera trifolii]|uniref:DNA topoisomerase (ATP-hydrolyzing) n=1 Tax=Heterodera trifolii TaxID=157864 RepID=A0ABD2LSD6_9BILA